jgi:hypothetical protein
MAFRMIMSTANMVSRARVGWFSPSTMIAEISETSMMITDKVRIRVP